MSKSFLVHHFGCIEQSNFVLLLVLPLTVCLTLFSSVTLFGLSSRHEKQTRLETDVNFNQIETAIIAPSHPKLQMLFVTVSLTFHSAQLTFHETNQILLSEFLSHLILLLPEKNNLKDLISDTTQSPTPIVSTIKN